MEAGTGNREVLYWRNLYEAAVLELDSRQIKQRIEAAQTAVTSRIEELNPSSNTVEAQELMNALSVLRELRNMVGEGGESDGSVAV